MPVDYFISGRNYNDIPEGFRDLFNEVYWAIDGSVRDVCLRRFLLGKKADTCNWTQNSDGTDVLTFASHFAIYGHDVLKNTSIILEIPRAKDRCYIKCSCIIRCYNDSEIEFSHTIPVGEDVIASIGDTNPGMELFKIARKHLNLTYPQDSGTYVYGA